jgi:hypothetical protein
MLVLRIRQQPAFILSPKPFEAKASHCEAFAWSSCDKGNKDLHFIFATQKYKV